VIKTASQSWGDCERFVATAFQNELGNDYQSWGVPRRRRGVRLCVAEVSELKVSLQLLLMVECITLAC
jgi:hypothetical protein